MNGFVYRVSFRYSLYLYDNQLTSIPDWMGGFTRGKDLRSLRAIFCADDNRPLFFATAKPLGKGLPSNRKLEKNGA